MLALQNMSNFVKSSTSTEQFVEQPRQQNQSSKMLPGYFHFAPDIDEKLSRAVCRIAKTLLAERVGASGVKVKDKRRGKRIGDQHQVLEKEKLEKSGTGPIEGLLKGGKAPYYPFGSDRRDGDPNEAKKSSTSASMGSNEQGKKVEKDINRRRSYWKRKPGGNI